MAARSTLLATFMTANLWHLSTGDICQPEANRTECGFPGITPDQCHKRRCCFDNDSTAHWCSKVPQPCISRAVTCHNHGECVAANPGKNVPAACKCDEGFSGPTCGSYPPPPPPNYSNVSVVHVINSCHLDIGFADSSQGIINRYFDHHIPTAITLGRQFRNAPEADRFTDKLGFMFQSWVVSFYLECPPGLGLHCPTPSQKADFVDAIKSGDITWHAFPHNAQLEIMEPALIEAGLALTWTLDQKFGLPRKATLSQRDVPGITRAVIPLLANAGVTAISIGANDGSTPPDLPKVFEFLDKNSNRSLLGLFNWPGYGGLKNGPVFIDGIAHALVYNFAGDNAGPQSYDQYKSTYNQLQKTFPNAEIVFSTFDNYTQHILPLLGKGILPVIDKEVGDTWIYGVPSDPQKVARFRVFNRAWRTARDLRGEAGFLGAALLNDDPVFLNATRFALKNGEHTWGKDVKSNLKDNTDWKNADFAKAKVPPSAVAKQFSVLEDSWWEQRDWGIAATVDTLVAGKHPIAPVLLAELAALKPSVPLTTQLLSAVAGTSYKCGSSTGAVTIAFDETGAVKQLDAAGSAWASASSALLKLKYRSYSAADVAKFFATYCKSTASWVQHDYGKPGLPSDVVGQVWNTTLVELYRSKNNCSFVVKMAFEPDASANYGAPKSAWANLTVTPTGIDVSIGLFDKTMTRLPEGMFVQFQPAPATGVWSANKLGEWIDSDDIIDGGTKHLHGVTGEGLRYTSPSGKILSIATTDAAVANFGELNAYPSPVHSDGDTVHHGSSFVLWDNLWGTNYIMWWPFEQPPPAEYASSAPYFPKDWNNDIASRFRVSW